MTRFRFSIDNQYAGRLRQVFRRPIENTGDKLTLLRLEFEIFTPKSDQTLQSYGDLACREIVIGPAAQTQRDANIVRYADLLGLASRHLDNLGGWLALQPTSKAAKGQRWIGIHFGAPSDVDYRQPFAKISKFSAAGWKVAEFRFPHDREWVRVGEVAKFFQISQSTVRRRIKNHERVFGTELVKRTTGRQREVNIRLLAHLLDAE